MTPENYCYWLQGLFELTNSEELSKEQVVVIKEHLQLVFTKVTPPLGVASLLELHHSRGPDLFTKEFQHRPYYTQDKEYC